MLVYGYPQRQIRGENEPYYPFRREENAKQYKLYVDEIAKLNGTIIALGRLPDYKHRNMHQTVARALHVFDK